MACDGDYCISESSGLLGSEFLYRITVVMLSPNIHWLSILVIFLFHKTVSHHQTRNSLPLKSSRSGCSSSCVDEAYKPRFSPRRPDILPKYLSCQHSIHMYSNTYYGVFLNLRAASYVMSYS